MMRMTTSTGVPDAHDTLRDSFGRHLDATRRPRTEDNEDLSGRAGCADRPSEEARDADERTGSRDLRRPPQLVALPAKE